MAEELIFDVDGTLVDSVDLHAKAWQDAFNDFGHHVEFDDIRAQIGKGGDQLAGHAADVVKDVLRTGNEAVRKEVAQSGAPSLGTSTRPSL